MATSSTIHETRRSVCDLWEPAIRYLRANPFNGIKVPLGEAPWSTWVLVGPFVAITLGIGLWTGQLDPGVASWWQFAVLPVVLIVFPAFIEEFFYRGILLPRSLLTASKKRRFVAVTASTALYVAAHPVSPLLGLSESDFFLQPAMLLVVALLGYVCGYAYLRSGSLRAPILIHWATVVVWNLFLGGVYSA